jgi:hypothetical protein
MQNRSDQFVKSILRDALRRMAAAQTEVEVTSAAQRIDVYSEPDPAREAVRVEMGLLGELASEPCMFEPYSETPGMRDVRRCLRKQLAWHHELERRTRAEAKGADDADPDAEPLRPVPFPALVVLSPGRPETVLELFRCEVLGPGVYAAAPGLELSVVVIAELPRVRGTVILRLAGRESQVLEAIEDLAALPDDAWEKSIVGPLLVHFRPELVARAVIEEGYKVSTEIQQWFEGYKRQLRNEGRDEGRDEGRKDGERKILLRLLRSRFGELPASVVARVEAAGVDEIELWADRVLSAKTLGEVLGEV